jgi:hypothetical protein
MGRFFLLWALVLGVSYAAATGPEVGTAIPSFEAADLDGNQRNFENLKGANGLVLLFVRSADW